MNKQAEPVGSVGKVCVSEHGDNWVKTKCPVETHLRGAAQIV